MSLKDCIDSAQRQGEITLEEAQALKKRYDAIARVVASPADAKRQMLDDLEAERLDKRRRALLTEARRQVVETAVMSHRNARGEIDPVQGLQKLIESFGYSKHEDIVNRQKVLMAEVHTDLDEVLYQFRKGAVSGDLRRMMPAVKARMDNLVRELYGIGTGDEAAKAMAKAWAAAAEKLRLAFNEAGGAVRKLEGGYIPQHHDRDAMLARGQRGWVEFIMPLLDREKMRHPLSGRAMSDVELRETLDYIWENVTSNGWLEREPSGASGGTGALFRRHADHRFLHFKDADAWLTYQRKFGEADPFAAMMGYVSTMTRDIAAMQILGPNPDAMFRYLMQKVEQAGSRAMPTATIIAEQAAQLKDLAGKLTKPDPKHAELSDRLGAIHLELAAIREKWRPQLGGKPSKRDRTKIEALQTEMLAIEEKLAPWRTGQQSILIDDLAVKAEMRDVMDAMREPVDFPTRRNPERYARRGLYRAESMWLLYKGTTNTPQDVMWANVMSTARNFASSTMLGSAILSSVSDFVTDGAARRMSGLPMMRSLTGMVQLFGPEQRREAVRSGLILDSAMSVMGSQGRYVKSVQAVKFTSYLADRNLALQGLSMWTQARKHAFGLDFQAAYADQAGKAWSDLDALYRDTLERHGFRSEDWDAIRKAELYEPKPGATFLRPNEIEAAAGRDLARKYLAMILRETRRGTIEGTIYARAGGFGGVGRTRPGTFAGEAMRSAAQFRSFAATFVIDQIEVIAHRLHREGKLAAAGYATAFAISSMIAGAVALQLKNLAAGRDPQDMTEKEFWGAALVQSGGLGIYGDFMTGSTNRFGGGIAQTTMGPVFDRVDNLWRLTGGNLMEVASDEKSNAGRELARFAENNTPILSTNWMVKQAYKRIMTDQLHYLLDPDAHAAFQRRIANRKKQWGQDFWWRPGSPAPDRAPDLGAAFGE